MANDKSTDKNAVVVSKAPADAGRNARYTADRLELIANRLMDDARTLAHLAKTMRVDGVSEITAKDAMLRHSCKWINAFVETARRAVKDAAVDLM
jgi:hypothetical protein